MRFSVWPSASYDWPVLLDLVSGAEKAGWDGAWLADHFMPNTESGTGEVQECLSLLGGLAATVPRIRLGSLVLGNTYRHPAVVANQARTIDRISGGRFVLGMGAGWQINEHAKFGIELPRPGVLLRRFDEALQVIRALRDEDRASFVGEFYTLDDAPMSPKPVGPMPILVGGGGEKVMPRIIARCADEWNVWGDPARFAHKSALITAACEAMGRDPLTVARSTQATVFLGPDGASRAAEQNLRSPAIGGTVEQLIDIVGSYVEAGLDELIIPSGARSPHEAQDLWGTFMEQILPNFRSV
jgi:alkanesulfonate monooxygenase SsuD/methylene tetrahydromethanopterin reductase-like flavin-dependent oxidoreductase (luciferase family)